MRYNLVTFSLAMSLIISIIGPALADPSEIVIEEPWARASIGMKRPGAAYLEVRNTSDEAKVIIGVETDLAGMPQMHETITNAAGVSSMRKIDRIEIEAGETYAFAPGGAHVMLMKLQRPMIKGEQFTLTLRLEDGGAISTAVPILGLAARGPTQ